MLCLADDFERIEHHVVDEAPIERVVGGAQHLLVQSVGEFGHLRGHRWAVHQVMIANEVVYGEVELCDYTAVGLVVASRHSNGCALHHVEQVTHMDDKLRRGRIGDDA